jgi:TetR/AcrR family transcriptional regulator, transcriptional repressor of bet genes
VQAAYREMLAGMTGTAVDAMAEAGDDPRQRLHDFIVANVSPPIADPKALSLWAAFIGRVRSDEELARIHRENYLVFIGILEDLVQAVLIQHHHKPVFNEVRHLAVAINGLIDGLWLENSLASDLFDEGPLSDIALDAVEAMLGGLSLRNRR